MNENKDFYSCLLLKAPAFRVRRRFTDSIFAGFHLEPDQPVRSLFDKLQVDPDAVLLVYRHKQHAKVTSPNVYTVLQAIRRACDQENDHEQTNGKPFDR